MSCLLLGALGGIIGWIFGFIILLVIVFYVEITGAWRPNK